MRISASKAIELMQAASRASQDLASHIRSCALCNEAGDLCPTATIFHQDCLYTTRRSAPYVEPISVTPTDDEEMHEDILTVAQVMVEEFLEIFPLPVLAEVCPELVDWALYPDQF